VDGARQPDVLANELVDGAGAGQHLAQGEGARGDFSDAKEVEAILAEEVGEDLRLEIGDLRLADVGGRCLESRKWKVGEPRLESGDLRLGGGGGCGEESRKWKVGEPRLENRRIGDRQWRMESGG
jgi:hypothetical protein